MPDFSIAEAVDKAFQNHAIVDIHTHLYPASMPRFIWLVPTSC